MTTSPAQPNFPVPSLVEYQPSRCFDSISMCNGAKVATARKAHLLYCSCQSARPIAVSDSSMREEPVMPNTRTSMSNSSLSSCAKTKQPSDSLQLACCMLLRAQPCPLQSAELGARGMLMMHSPSSWMKVFRLNFAIALRIHEQ